MLKNNLGQYFTKNLLLQNKIYKFILNKPKRILEPSIGRGDLIYFIKNKLPYVVFDMYEIDKDIELLDNINRKRIKYGNFLTQKIDRKYSTIIGNPPYIRTKKGNLYIDFIEKCFNLLDNKGELIFIVPSDFLKLTAASKLLNNMMEYGTFTHIFHPNDEKLFENASIDIIIFRYCKDTNLEKKVLFNDNYKFIININGLITFNETDVNDCKLFKDYFDVYVGLVSAKEDVFKNKELGNIDVINGLNKVDRYIFIEEYPSDNDGINQYLEENKDILINRKIRKFTEKNWFEWGAPRNITTIRKNMGKDCIYVYNLTRKNEIAFASKVSYFGGGLIMLIPKNNIDIDKVVSYMNQYEFKKNFMFSGRFKIGHRQISNSPIFI